MKKLNYIVESNTPLLINCIRLYEREFRCHINNERLKTPEKFNMAIKNLIDV